MNESYHPCLSLTPTPVTPRQSVCSTGLTHHTKSIRLPSHSVNLPAHIHRHTAELVTINAWWKSQLLCCASTCQYDSWTAATYVCTEAASGCVIGKNDACQSRPSSRQVRPMYDKARQVTPLVSQQPAWCWYRCVPSPHLLTQRQPDSRSIPSPALQSLRPDRGAVDCQAVNTSWDPMGKNTGSHHAQARVHYYQQ